MRAKLCSVIQYIFPIWAPTLFFMPALSPSEEQKNNTKHAHTHKELTIQPFNLYNELTGGRSYVLSFIQQIFTSKYMPGIGHSYNTYTTHITHKTFTKPAQKNTIHTKYTNKHMQNNHTTHTTLTQYTIYTQHKKHIRTTFIHTTNPTPTHAHNIHAHTTHTSKSPCWNIFMWNMTEMCVDLAK